MSDAVDVLKNLDRRVSALESERSDEMGESIVQIAKLYGDIEIEIRLKAYLHRYHRCGEQINSIAITGAQANSPVYIIRAAPYLRL